MIPARLLRTVPAQTSQEVEHFWSHACDLHLAWDHVTFRDPIDPKLFPLSSSYWDRCTSGAQLAGLVRLEALWHQGGIYLDSDCQLFRSLDPLREHQAFAAWEDENTVPDAVLGAEARHPAILACLQLALRRLGSDNQQNTDWRTDSRAWSTGPGVTTTVLVDRPDVHLYAPIAFYPVHYSEKEHLDEFVPGPDTFLMHRWHASWL